jgi:hypothetical protein
MRTSRPGRRASTTDTLHGPPACPPNGPLVRGREPAPGSARRTRSTSKLPSRRTMVMTARTERTHDRHGPAARRSCWSPASQGLGAHGAGPRAAETRRPTTHRRAASPCPCPCPSARPRHARRPAPPRHPASSEPCAPWAARRSAPPAQPRRSPRAGGMPGFSTMRTMVRIQRRDASPRATISGRLGDNLPGGGCAPTHAWCAAAPRRRLVVGTTGPPRGT